MVDKRGKGVGLEAFMGGLLGRALVQGEPLLLEVWVEGQRRGHLALGHDDEAGAVHQAEAPPPPLPEQLHCLAMLTGSNPRDQESLTLANQGREFV